MQEAVESSSSICYWFDLVVGDMVHTRPRGREREREREREEEEEES